MKTGIDISHWNGLIDFNRVKTDFVIIKVSQGTHKDVNFDRYYNDCKAPKGAYIYNKVLTVADARKEAEFAVKCLQGKTLEYGVWLDLEDTSMRILSKKVLNDIISTEAGILQAAGFNVGIYCNRDWYLRVLDSAMLSVIYPFWIARYPSADNGTIKESLSPKNLNGCKIWQYSSKGKVSGISGNVDLNLLYDEPFTKLKQPVKTIDDLAREVIAGVYGTGDARKKALGAKYEAVQTRVNQILKGLL